MLNHAAADSSLEGPLDVAQFPETLTARVVTPGPAPLLHGYDVQRDLARHYDTTDVLFLSLTGELPQPGTTDALRIALVFLAPLSVQHASVHAAALARLCGTTSASTLGVAAIALAEQARVLLEEHAALLAWLTDRHGSMPAQYGAEGALGDPGTDRLVAALGEKSFAFPELGARPKLPAALLIVLFGCGLKTRPQLEAAIVTARLPSAMAEAMAEKVTDFDHYPTNLPRYRYQEAQ